MRECGLQHGMHHSCCQVRALWECLLVCIVGEIVSYQQLESHRNADATNESKLVDVHGPPS